MRALVGCSLPLCSTIGTKDAYVALLLLSPSMYCCVALSVSWCRFANTGGLFIAAVAPQMVPKMLTLQCRCVLLSVCLCRYGSTGGLFIAAVLYNWHERCLRGITVSEYCCVAVSVSCCRFANTGGLFIAAVAPQMAPKMLTLQYCVIVELSLCCTECILTVHPIYEHGRAVYSRCALQFAPNVYTLQCCVIIWCWFALSVPWCRFASIGGLSLSLLCCTNVGGCLRRISMALVACRIRFSCKCNKRRCICTSVCLRACSR